MFTPGDSPMGLRLPLSSLSWRRAPEEPEHSPLEQRGELPAPSPGSPMRSAPEAVWVDVDPTNDQLLNDRYITTA